MIKFVNDKYFNLFIKLYFLIVISVSSSCNKVFDYEYGNDKESYLKSVGCLRAHCSDIIDFKSKKPSISIYLFDLKNNLICGGLDSIMQKHAIEFVTLDIDSTVSFYSELQRGIKDRQYILMFIDRRIDIYKKISSDIKILQKLDDNCYELERVVSLAN